MGKTQQPRESKDTKISPKKSHRHHHSTRHASQSQSKTEATEDKHSSRSPQKKHSSRSPQKKNSSKSPHKRTSKHEPHKASRPHSPHKASRPHTTTQNVDPKKRMSPEECTQVQDENRNIEEHMAVDEDELPDLTPTPTEQSVVFERRHKRNHQETGYKSSEELFNDTDDPPSSKQSKIYRCRSSNKIYSSSSDEDEVRDEENAQTWRDDLDNTPDGLNPDTENPNEDGESPNPDDPKPDEENPVPVEPPVPSGDNSSNKTKKVTPKGHFSLTDEQEEDCVEWLKNNVYTWSRSHRDYFK